MFKITIEGSTISELAANALALAAQFGEVAAADPKPRAKKAAATVTETASSTPSQTSALASAVVDETDRELLAEVPPAPATANSVVDAGTGQPVAQPTKKVTMDDIRAAATDLAGKDTAKLKALISKHGGTKLSDIPPENLPAFAGEVFEAVG